MMSAPVARTSAGLHRLDRRRGADRHEGRRADLARAASRSCRSRARPSVAAMVKAKRGMRHWRPSMRMAPGVERGCLRRAREPQTVRVAHARLFISPLSLLAGQMVYAVKSDDDVQRGGDEHGRNLHGAKSKCQSLARAPMRRHPRHRCLHCHRRQAISSRFRRPLSAHICLRHRQVPEGRRRTARL